MNIQFIKKHLLLVIGLATIVGSIALGLLLQIIFY